MSINDIFIFYVRVRTQALGLKPNIVYKENTVEIVKASNTSKPST